MKTFKYLILPFLLGTINTSCVSTTDANSDTDELGSIDSQLATDDAEVNKALEDVGGPIEEAVVEENTTDSAPQIDAEQPEAESLAKDDVESYKLSDESKPGDDVSPTGAASEPLEEAVQVEKQPDLDLSVPVAEREEIPAAAPERNTKHVATVSEAVDQPTGDQILYPLSKGESLSMVSKKLLGSIKGWRKLAKLNNLKNPNRVSAGAMLIIPVSDSNRSRVANYVAKHARTTKVKRGDTLAKIASRVLGSKVGWKYLWKNNEGVVANPHRIEIGTVLNYLGSSKSNRGVAAKTAPENGASH